MAKHKRRNKGRQKFLPLQTPNPNPEIDLDRDSWINQTFLDFVSNSEANKSYYRVVLETLWPKYHGIPGPIITTAQLRDSIDNYRKQNWKSNKPYKPYVDVFRRIRELQGEEGVVGIAREGNSYQLVDLTLAPKRVPRVKLSDHDWEKILKNYNYSCAVCGRKPPEVKFDQDHKIPRTRGGGNDLTNWQPLCGECNNFKSTSCRGCKLDCSKCSWAFPEKYAPLRISSDHIQKVRSAAKLRELDPHFLINFIIDKHFDENL